MVEWYLSFWLRYLLVMPISQSQSQTMIFPRHIPYQACDSGDPSFWLDAGPGERADPAAQ